MSDHSIKKFEACLKILFSFIIVIFHWIHSCFFYLPTLSLWIQLSDFGLAVADGAHKNNIKLSGTLGYVAPEYLLDGMPTKIVIIEET